MVIETIDDLRRETYMLKYGEICTFPQCGNAKKAFMPKHRHKKEFNCENNIVIFYDERSQAYITPYFYGIIDIFVESGYHENFSMSVPLSGWAYPELKDKWEAIQRKLAFI